MSQKAYKRTRIAAVCLLALVSVTGCGTGQNEQPRTEPIPVKVITIRESASGGSRNYIGNVVPSKSAVLSCSYPGTLAELKVSEGDRVRKGDTIARIESQSVISSREMAHATLRQAADGFERISKVHGSGSVADVKMVEIETQLNKARAAAMAADKALENCTVTAPFDGIIDKVYPEQGMETGAAEPLARILDIESVEISFSVPENEIAAIGMADTASVKTPALGEEGFPAILKNKGVTASPLSHSYTCTAVPLNKPENLMPGMVCKVSFERNAGKWISIPASIVRTDEYGRYVWTVCEGKVGKRYITAGGFSGTGIVVSSGLSEGDTVIREGMQKVSSGMEVKIIE